jgi:hypothetical protein
MFRFVLVVAFIRRLVHLRVVRYTLFVLFLGALIAGVVYACVVLNALKDRSYSPDVHTNSAH